MRVSLRRLVYDATGRTMDEGGWMRWPLEEDD